VAAGASATPSFAVPVGSPQGNAPVRCRISTQAGLGVTGLAPDGEVEDHLAPIGAEQPQIGAVKTLVSTVRDGSNPLLFTVTFDIKVTNLGNVPLSEVQVTDDLAAAFAGATGFTVTSLTSGEFTVNGSYNGSSDTNLLAAGNSLAVGASGTIRLVVRLSSGGRPGPYTNQASASGRSPATVTVTHTPPPVTFVVPVSVVQIPTLDLRGLLLLATLLGLLGVGLLARRS
jgi:uncharacterized repeat protein (TIGR01451 family)